MEQRLDEQKFPGVDSAFEIAMKSYDIVLRRSDAADAGLDRLLTVAVTVTVGIITILSRSDTVSFHSWLFYLSVALCLGVVIICIGVKNTSEFRIIGPKKVLDKWENYSERHFKRSFVLVSGKQFDANTECVNNKVRWSQRATVLFIAELILLAIWIISL